VKFHRHTVGSIRNNQKRVPLIRLSGRRLERHGFKPGRKFTVYELSGCLVLSLPRTGKNESEE
jgi:hypothetical protein